jgi:hypothetical protein
MRVPFGAAGQQRLDATAAIELLNGGLFVEADDGGMPRRIEVEAKDIGALSLKVGGSLEASLGGNSPLLRTLFRFTAKTLVDLFAMVLRSELQLPQIGGVLGGGYLSSPRASRS